MPLPLYDRRMLEIIQYFKRVEGVSQKEFLKNIGFENDRNLYKVRNGEMSFTIQQVNSCIKKYKINPAYFFDSKALRLQ